MGAQAAALLDAGGPVGDVPPEPAYVGSRQLPAPAGYDLRRVALLHGGVGLAPTAWDGARLHLRLPGPVVVDARLLVRWAGRPPAAAALRRVLALDDDLDELWAACDTVPVLAGLRPRVLRSPTVWQDLVGTLAGTRASYRSTQAMVRALVGDGPFPGPAQVPAADLSPWGYRAPFLRGLAARVVDGWDPEQLLDPALSDADVLARVRALAGFGPFATAQLQPLLGRPRPLVLDGWLRTRLGGAGDAELLERFAPMGRWAGTGAWLAAVAGRLRDAPEGPHAGR
ncbi:MAG TPA: hypothetical protein VFR07_09950 [Mycobacteriales bacterium]|nr:hypothetical protein [Mycobacteriales bacterium]